MRIHLIGAAHEVTGSCTLPEVCGREQGIDVFADTRERTAKRCWL